MKRLGFPAFFVVGAIHCLPRNIIRDILESPSYTCLIFEQPHMLDFSQTQLSKLMVHKVGNKVLEDGVTLSDEPIEIKGNEALVKALNTYFLGNFKEPVFYQFHHVSDLQLNEVYSISNALFESTRGFVKKSKDIANILYEYSTHPKIKAGELYIAYFEDCVINNESTDAIGIFKSENKDTFLKVEEAESGFGIRSEDGINIKRLEKGCLIFNMDADEGFRVCVVDNQNSQEAQYWKDEFLKLKPLADNYFQTRNYMDLAKKFVTDKLDDEFEVSKADQIDYLNRSIEYFKKHEQFNELDFQANVFEHQSVINSFKNYKKEFQIQNDLNIVGEFDISVSAVKRQAKIFKSVLKLDRNFHVYIHGDRSLIEQGVEEDGRKYYKIYYDVES